MAGAIAAAAGYGVDSIRVRLDSATYSDSIFGGTATALFTLGSGGLVTGTGSSYTWLLVGSAADYEVFASISSGSLTSGTTGSWLPLSTSREWSVQRSSVGTKACTLQVQIREAAAPNAVLATATVLLSATREASEP